MKRLWLVVAVLTLLAVPASAGTKAGDTEVTLSGSYQNFGGTNMAGSDVVTLATGMGYFVTKEAEVGGTVMGQWGDNQSGLAFSTNFKWHFNTNSDVVPYVGPQVGLYHQDMLGLDATDFSWGALVGVKVFVSQNVNIFAEYNLLRVEAAIAHDIHSFFFGIGYTL